MNHPIFLEKRINGTCKKFNSEDIKPNVRGEIQVASDTFFIKDIKKPFLYYLVNTFIFFLIYCLVFFGIIELFEIKYNYLNQWCLITFILFSLIISIQAYSYFKIDNKKLILDRMNSTVTLPRPFFLKAKIIPFRQLEAFKKLTGIASDYGDNNVIMKLYLKGKYSDFKYKLDAIYTDTHVTQYKYLNTNKIESYWNFIVWYMDKNRPLPPGTAFDKYRQHDFERRKAEGFPHPLYKSLIETPEFNNIHQKEYKNIQVKK